VKPIAVSDIRLQDQVEADAFIRTFPANAPNSLLLGKYREFCPFRLLGAVRMVQNASTVTIIYEKIPRKRKLRVSSRIELGNQSSVWQGAFIGVSWQLC
jgi:hypothetical protein